MGVSGDDEAPTSSVGAHWLGLGLGLVLILILLVAIKKTLKWFKKGKNTMS